ncbi:hypothetical protein U1Q18_023757 [Sarracenia purpurea var. burkii]
MSNQPRSVRPWYRIASVGRPAPAPAPAPTQAPPAAASSPAAIALPPRPTEAPLSQLPTATTTSFPLSPIINTYPAPAKSSPTSTTPPMVSSSVPPLSPKSRVLVPSSQLPTLVPKTVSPTPAPQPARSLAELQPIPAIPPVVPQPPLLSVDEVAASALIHMPTTPPSPKVAEPHPKTESPCPKVPSPNNKFLSPPLSPLTLPPAQLNWEVENERKILPEAEQKTVLVQETIEKPKAMPKASDGDLQRHTIGEKNHSPDIPLKEKRDVSDAMLGTMVITMAGENKGAIMELSPSYTKPNLGGNPQSVRKRSNAISLSDGGGGSTEEGRLKSINTDKSDIALATPTSPLNMFTNSNVQGVNNSILYNSSCTHHDPGVHLSFSRNSNGSINKKSLGS